MTRRRVLSALACGLLIAAVPGLARGGDSAGPALEIRVIHALREDGGLSMDPQLRDLPQLTRDQPFVRYNVFKLLDSQRPAWQQGQPVSYALVDGRTLHVTLVEVVGQNADARYRVRAEIAGPGKKAFLKLLEVTAGANEPFFVGGQTYAGGRLFLELAVRP